MFFRNPLNDIIWWLTACALKPKVCGSIPAAVYVRCLRECKTGASDGGVLRRQPSPSPASF